MSTATTRTRKTSTDPLRFAHPFFTHTPPKARTATKYGKRMLEYIQGTLHRVPKPSRNAVMSLADIIGTKGAQDIENAGAITFHAVGDTGRGKDTPQGHVADAMTADFDISHPERSPAFFFHLGDVIYGIHKDQSYRPEFYEPYVHYPGKIIAIPGNHDGEVFRNTDPKSLEAFLTNFCAADAAPPPMAGSILRETMTQPGVYWWLDAPFIDIIGLYSNAAENPGFISGPIPGAHQKKWLVAALKAIKKKRAGGEQKALLIATHHPPFSAAGHSGSATMLADIDDACAKAGVLPDIFLAGHSHNYQRFTRTVTLAGAAWQIPFIVAGMGGRNDQSVKPATGHADGDHTLVATRRGYGYLLIAAQRGLLTVRNIGLDAAGERLAADADRVTVDLTTHTIQP